MKFSLLFKGACLLILAVDAHACFLFFHREFTSLSYNLFLITHTGYCSLRIHRLYLAPDEEDKVKFEHTLVKEFCAGEVSFRAVFTHPLRPMIASS